MKRAAEMAYLYGGLVLLWLVVAWTGLAFYRWLQVQP